MALFELFKQYKYLVFRSLFGIILKYGSQNGCHFFGLFGTCIRIMTSDDFSWWNQLIVLLLPLRSILKSLACCFFKREVLKMIRRHIRHFLRYILLDIDCFLCLNSRSLCAELKDSIYSTSVFWILQALAPDIRAPQQPKWLWKKSKNVAGSSLRTV